MKALIPILLFSFIIACQPKETFSVKIDAEHSQIDSLYIMESSTEKLWLSLAVGERSEPVYTQIDYPTTGSIQTKDGRQSRLTILSPGKALELLVSDSVIMNEDLGDSLLNYLSESNNEFIALNADLIFGSDDLDSMLRVFHDFKEQRSSEIEKRSERLSLLEKELLLYQNTARIYSVLFYYGRLVKNMPSDHPFFSFIDEIDNNTPWTKTLPHNLLYKHEINYLRENGAISSNAAFMDYVASQTSNDDLLDFLKATYISEIVQSPSYWQKHEAGLTIDELEKIIEKERSNKYFDLIEKPAGSFFSSQKGMKAYDFEAERADGTKVKLSDLKGKVVFIDAWASWCGPCVAERPNILKLAEKYSANDKVEVLMISMDDDRSHWIRYLTRKNQLNIDGDLFIQDGMHNKFGDQFNVKHIPRYILIDQHGVIVNANISGASIAAEKMIEKELTKM